MQSITYQSFLRPALPVVIGPKEYRQERELFIRIDEILTTSGLEIEFIALSMKHCGFDPARQSAKRKDAFNRASVLALRSNIARHFKRMDHREFCIRLADSPLLQWFLQIGRVDKVKAFAKSTSDRFARWIDEPGLRVINHKLTALLAGTGVNTTPLDLHSRSQTNSRVSLALGRRRVRWGHEPQALDRAVGWIGGKTGDLPLYLTSLRSVQASSGLLLLRRPLV